MPTAKAGYRLADGSKVPSVTTILGAFKESGGLVHWAWKLGTEGKDYRKVRDDAASAGTLAHDFVERYLHSRPLPEPDGTVPAALWNQAVASLEAFQTWFRSIDVVIAVTEVSLVSELYRYGGTLDAIGRVNGKRVILDWKSGNRIYGDAVAQCAAYAQLWNESKPADEPVAADEAHIVRIPKDGIFDPATCYKVVPLEAGWEYFKAARVAYETKKHLEKAVA